MTVQYLRPNAPGSLIKRPGPPRRDEDREAEQVQLVQKMLDAGASLAAIGATLGRDRFHVQRLMERYGIVRRTADRRAQRSAQPERYRPLVLLIPPVREAGLGRPGGQQFDLEDTDEL